MMLPQYSRFQKYILTIYFKIDKNNRIDKVEMLKVIESNNFKLFLLLLYNLYIIFNVLHRSNEEIGHTENRRMSTVFNSLVSTMHQPFSFTYN